MRISKIERQKRRASRRSVFLDGAFAFGASDDVLLKYSLHEGAELDQEAVENIIRAEEEETAKQKALRYLSIRPRSKKEIRDYLSRKEYAGSTAERIVAKLESLHLLDDAAFARMVCRDMLAKKPAGEKLVRQSLFRKGVPKDLIDTVAAEFFSPEAELLLAVQAAERQRLRVDRGSKKLDTVQFKKKILDYLVRRGFNFETAMSATNKLFSKSS